LVYQPLCRLKVLRIAEGQPAQVLWFIKKHPLGVGLSKEEDFHIPGKADNPGPGHRSPGLERGDPEEEVLLTTLIRQAQISDRKDPGSGTCTATGLIVGYPDE
jgi:hypothetical protein